MFSQINNSFDKKRLKNKLKIKNSTNTKLKEKLAKSIKMTLNVKYVKIIEKIVVFTRFVFYSTAKAITYELRQTTIIGRIWSGLVPFSHEVGLPSIFNKRNFCFINDFLSEDPLRRAMRRLSV